MADCLDVMTSDRPYRKALTYEEARAEITRFAGSQFDPGVVKYFLHVPLSVWTDIRITTGRTQTRTALDLNNLAAYLPAVR